MTGRGQISLRIQTALDRLAWGFGDLRRVLIEHGVWPAKAQIVASSDGGCWQVVGTQRRASTGKEKAVGLLVPESSCHWGSAQLPDMPRGSLENAVAEILWRVSPLPTEQIVAAWRAEPRAQGGWLVEWGMCKRSVQDDLLHRQDLPGDAPVYLARQGRALAVRGMAQDARKKRQHRMDGLVVGLSLLMLAMISLPALMPLVLKRQAVVRAVQHVSALEPKAAPLRQQLDELRRQSALAEELRQNLGADLPLASAIEALSETLPADAWLDRIEINGSEIRITGLAANATDLVAQLGRQPVWAEVRAAGANVRENTLNKERFTFEMRWRGAGVKP